MDTTLNNPVDNPVDINQSKEVASSSKQSGGNVPQKVSDPHEGMIFTSQDAAEQYWAQYGRENGFPTRLKCAQKKKLRDGEANYLQLVCARQGVHTKKIVPQNPENPIIRRNSSTIKCGCEARMRVIRFKDNLWKVSKFHKEHNHKLVSPEKFIHMKGHRHMPEVVKSLTMAFEEENLPVGKVAAVMRGDLVGFDERDCYNHLNATRKYMTPMSGDATATLTYFKKKSLEDPQFFYNVQTDYQGRAINFFWVDGRSRQQYIHFGDVVSFDTTYKKNVYEMPFGPFTGVNHHSQSIQFGCGLLLDESEESFIWLFETWLAAMGGRPPVSILTDQDRSITNAVAKVFPSSRHRFCLWHIESKFPEKLAHVYAKKPQFKETMRRCLWWPFRVSDFEARWEKMLVDYDLVGHEWLGQLYDMREKWIPVYHYDTFYAGMSTTGRSEGMNSVFKDYFSHSTSLRNFVTKFEKCLHDISQRENTEDYHTEHSRRVMEEGSSCILEHASKLYTRKIYDKFKKELNKAQSDLKIKVESPSIEYNSYTIMSRRAGDHVEWHVRFSMTALEGSCECKMFSYTGIPCRHLLKVFLRHDMDEIPKSFILRRWTQGANQYRAMDGTGIVEKAKESSFLKILHGSRLANQLLAEASVDDELFSVFVDTLTTLAEKFTEIKATRHVQPLPTPSVDDEVIINPQVSEEPNDEVILNPLKSKSKGRPVQPKKSSRIKRGIEESQEDGRLCNGCGGIDTGHDIRNCPNPHLAKAGIKPNKKKCLKRKASTDVSNVSSPAKCTRSKTLQAEGKRKK